MNTNPIVTIIIKNQKGQFFVHQRNSNKKTFPDKYGLGAGGHMEPNESSDEAARRELKEETRLVTPVKYLFSINYKDENSNYPIFVYETATNEDIKNNETEWQWSGWMEKREVDTLLSINKLCPDTAVFYLKYLDEFSL